MSLRIPHMLSTRTIRYLCSVYPICLDYELATYHSQHSHRNANEDAVKGCLYFSHLSPTFVLYEQFNELFHGGI